MILINAFLLVFYKNRCWSIGRRNKDESFFFQPVFKIVRICIFNVIGDIEQMTYTSSLTLKNYVVKKWNNQLWFILAYIEMLDANSANPVLKLIELNKDSYLVDLTLQ